MRVDKAKILLIIVLVLSVASFSNAIDVIYVDVNGPNDPGTGTSEDPFRRIQDAIDAANAGDVVEIQPGLYTGHGNCDLDPNGKSITIRSTEPNAPNIVANTIINPNGTGRGFHIHSGEDANCVISGLTIKNAYILGVGAGIYCQQSNPTITNCSFIDNYAEMYGGAVFCMESNSLFINCTISGNYAYDGGGVSIRSGYPQLINCIISNNHAIRYGGGVDCYYQGNPDLTNCSLINNKTETEGAGGAICLWGSNVNIKNSILWANEAKTGAQLYLHFESIATVSYCDVQGGISDVCAPDSIVNWGSGNIDIDPCFALFDPNGDPNLWDLHLQSEYGRWVPNSQSWVTDSNTSPCIDTGDPNSDWTDEPWPNGKRINMGAYGGTTQASMNGNPADFDIDGTVNFADFAAFADKWFAQVSCIEDLNGNNVVDFGDLHIFTENWLWQRE
jgi:hypothetical protein